MRDVFESIICCLDHWLSCMLDYIHVCVFLFSINCFEKLAQHLLDTSLIASYLSSFLSFFLSQSHQQLDTLWINRESLCPLDSFLILGGSIELHLLLLVFVFLDSFSTHYLSTLFFSTPTRQIPRHLINTLSVEIYWRFYLSSSCDPSVIFSISLSIDLCFLSYTISSLPQICSTRFLQASPSFLHVVSFYSLAFHAFMFLKPKFWDFFKNFGFFKIDEILLKFWVSFWRFDLKNFMHCITFAL